MQSAGLAETRSYPPIQNLAKSTKLRYQAEYPHFVYSMLAIDFQLSSYTIFLIAFAILKWLGF